MKGEEEREEREERDRSGERGEVGREAEAAFPRGRRKKRELRPEAEDQPASVDGGESGRGLSLKEIEQSLQSPTFIQQHLSAV